jgi:hypothetical protein
MTAPRSRVMAVLTVLAMLGIGIAIGVAADRLLLRRRWENRGFSRGGGPEGPLSMMRETPDTAIRNRMRARIIGRITTEMALTPVQARAIDSIFHRRELQLDSLRLRVAPQLDSLRLQMRASIDSVLTPEQRVRFAEQRKRMDERRNGRSRP